MRLRGTRFGQYPLLTKDDEVRLAQEIEIETSRFCAAHSGTSVTQT